MTTDLKIGDMWELSVNTGIIPRTVTNMGTKYVEYRNASGYKKICEIRSFLRWAKTAELVFRKSEPPK